MREFFTLIVVFYYAAFIGPYGLAAQELAKDKNGKIGLENSEFSQSDVLEAPFIYVSSNINLGQPSWVSYMYKKPYDVEGISQQYEDYYADNEFVKNQHTQFYKRLLRGHSRISYDYSKSSSAIKKGQAAYLKNRMNSASKMTGQWSPVGPTNIDIDALVSGSTPGTAHVQTLSFCVGQEQHILAGTASAGLWKTSDNGENWEAISSDLPITWVYACAFMPMNPSTIYLGGTNVFYKSTNGGVSWTETGGAGLSNSNYVSRKILVDSSDPNIVYLATKTGFFKSTDAGENFTEILDGSIIDINQHPFDHEVLYVIKGVGNRTEFYRSSDGGDSFSMFDEGYPVPLANEEQKRTVLAVSPDEPDAIFALAVGKINNGNGLVGIYKSSNQGTTWARRCCGDTDGGPASASNLNVMEWGCSGTADGGQYYYDLALGVSPTNSNELFTGGINLWKSTDGGTSVTCHSNYLYGESPETYVHADIHDIKYINGAIWIASDGGIFLSSDGGENFSKQMNGIHGTDFRGFDVAFYDENIMLGGTYHNGTMLKEGDTYINEWVSTRSGDRRRSFINSGENNVVYDDSSIRILTGERTIAPHNQVLSRKPNSNFTTGESSEIVFDPFQYNRFYLGQSGSLYRTDNNGVTFEEVHNFGSGKVTSIEVSSSLPGLLYIVFYPSYSAPKKIMRSTDHGQSWIEVTVPSSLYGDEDMWVAWDITIGSTSPYKIWAARTPQVTNGLNLDGKMLFYSSNGGDTWTNVSSNTLDGEYPTNIVHQIGTDDVVYLGTRRAVYFKEGDQPFQLLSNGLPAYTFSTKLVPHYRSGKLFNATHRGLFEMELVEDGILAVPMVNKRHSGCLRDTFYFKDHSPVSNNSSRVWTFEGADVESSTGLSPKVTYSQAGVYPVKLVVTSGSSSYTYESLNFIEVEDGCAIDTIVGNALTISSNSFAKIPPFNDTFDELTITAWVKRNSIIYNSAGVALHREGPKGHGLIINPDGYLCALWDDNNPSFESSLYVPYNKWAHVAMTVEADGISLYLNGIKQFQSRTIQPKEFKNFFFIGGDEFIPSAVMNGSIDEICFHNKALSASEIQLSMNLVQTDPPASLISYFQANNLSGDMMDRVGNLHAYLVNNASRNPSMAPVASGCADLVDIYGPGTYTFECSGVEMTFNEGDSTPNGPVSIVEMYDLPELPLPPGGQFSESYWVINNFGDNQNITAPSDLKISGFGYVGDESLQNPGAFSMYMVPTFWEYGWGAEIDSPDSLSSEENTTFIFDQADNMSYFGKVMLGGEVSPVLSVVDITLAGEFVDNYVHLTWTGVEEDMEYELLKSETGQDFYVIDSGKGIKSEGEIMQSYHDSRLQSPVSYYKLRVVDNLNESWETKVILVQIPLIDELDFYPNLIQSGEPITMRIGEGTDVKWELYDMQGRLIKGGMQSEPEVTHDISASSGQYVLKMSQSNISKSDLLIIQ